MVDSEKEVATKRQKKEGLLFLVALFFVIFLQSQFALSDNKKAGTLSNVQDTTQDSTSKNQPADLAGMRQFYQEVTTSQDRIFKNIMWAVGIFMTALTIVVGFFSFFHVRKSVETEITQKTVNLEFILRQQFGRIAPLYQIFSTAFLTENSQDSELFTVQKRLLRIATELSVGELFVQANNLTAAKDAFSRAQLELRRLNERTRENLQSLDIIPSIPQLVTALNASALNLHGVRGFEDDRDALIALRLEVMNRFL